MPADVFNAALSDGFAVIYPEARPEYYNTQEHPQAARRADEQAHTEALTATVGGEVDKKMKTIDEPFASPSSALTKRTRAVGS